MHAPSKPPRHFEPKHWKLKAEISGIGRSLDSGRVLNVRITDNVPADFRHPETKGHIPLPNAIALHNTRIADLLKGRGHANETVIQGGLAVIHSDASHSKLKGERVWAHVKMEEHGPYITDLELRNEG